MSSVDTTALSGRVLADGFADRIRRWSRDTGAPENATRVAQRAAFVVSMATLDGNVCTDLSDIAAALNDGSDTETVRQRLLEKLLDQAYFFRQLPCHPRKPLHETP